MKKEEHRKPKPLDEIETTKDIEIPKDIIEQVIGQDAAVKKVKLAMQQRRNLLLVGPPGVGKSMLAQALALHLQKPKEQINIIHNPQNPERPLVEVIRHQALEKIVTPEELPVYVAEQLGFKCFLCGAFSDVNEHMCPKCGTDKYKRVTKKDEIRTTYFNKDGREEGVTYHRIGKNKIQVTGIEPETGPRAPEKKLKCTLVPINRKTFIHATGASETELLGDVRHDPYGSHPEIGTPAYLRVVPGAIHEAHEGVLFIDELPHLGHLQNFILTAMQERKFPIVGRNPQSAGASVKVEDVPCDFLFVGACNIKDVQEILSPLRSRIIGNGYEILLNSVMPNTEENRNMLLQFVAQEIQLDGRIPHATKDAVIEIIAEAEKRAKIIDDAKNSLTLRLREIGGIVRTAGDFAVFEGSEFIERRHIKKSIDESKPIEYQLQERYGSLWKGLEKDAGINLNQDHMGSSYL